jgi:hypothetical protein
MFIDSDWIGFGRETDELKNGLEKLEVAIKEIG